MKMAIVSLCLVQHHSQMMKRVAMVQNIGMNGQRTDKFHILPARKVYTWTVERSMHVQGSNLTQGGSGSSSSHSHLCWSVLSPMYSGGGADWQEERFVSPAKLVHYHLGVLMAVLGRVESWLLSRLYHGSWWALLV